MPRPCPHNVLRFYRKNVYYCQKCFMPLATSMTDHPSWDEMKLLKGPKVAAEWDELKTRAQLAIAEDKENFGFTPEIKVDKIVAGLMQSSEYGGDALDNPKSSEEE